MRPGRRAYFSISNVAAVLAAVGLMALMFLVGCAAPLVRPTPPVPPAPTVPTEARLALQPATFAQLQGWSGDAHGEALVAFRTSCARLTKLPTDRPLSGRKGDPGGVAGDWTAACSAAASLDAAGDAAARRFFETWFQPWAVSDNNNARGLFTGYFEPELRAARKRGGPYQTPLLARPGDLITASLGHFDEELNGVTIWGKVEGGRLHPYADRATIEAGLLGGRERPLFWVDNPVDAFFLHVQGSGRLRLVDGTVVRVGFAGKNGRPYKSIGRILIDRGEISADHLTMASIRDWVRDNPEAGKKLLKENPSYVFFRQLSGPGPIGSQGAPLTAGRSLAVDRRFLPMGPPVWVETRDPQKTDKPFNRLMVAQDTGGAIKGVVRGDIFFGSGDAAGVRAGTMKYFGRYYILLPVGHNPAAGAGR